MHISANTVDFIKIGVVYPFNNLLGYILLRLKLNYVCVCPESLMHSFGYKFSIKFADYLNIYQVSA